MTGQSKLGTSRADNSGYFEIDLATIWSSALNAVLERKPGDRLSARQQ